MYENTCKQIVGLSILLCLAVYVLCNTVGAAFGLEYISVLAAASESNRYEVRSRLLMQAMDRVGVCDAAEAAEVWAEGLRSRSAALQYAAMTRALREEYAAQLEESASNWVTGVSSPWVESYRITDLQAPAKDRRVVTLLFSTQTSTGPAGDYSAVLTLVPEDGFWRIAEISADSELYPYTRYRKKLE